MRVPAHQVKVDEMILPNHSERGVRSEQATVSRVLGRVDTLPEVLINSARLKNEALPHNLEMQEEIVLR